MLKAGEYSLYDETGLPTHDAKGKELSKEIRNKLQKEQNKQKKVYEDYLKSLEQK